MPNCQNVRCMKCQNCQNIPHKPLTVTLALLFFLPGEKNWKTAKQNQTILETDIRHFRIC